MADVSKKYILNLSQSLTSDVQNRVVSKLLPIYTSLQDFGPPFVIIIDSEDLNFELLSKKYEIQKNGISLLSLIPQTNLSSFVQNGGCAMISSGSSDESIYQTIESLVQAQSIWPILQTKKTFVIDSLNETGYHLDQILYSFVQESFHSVTLKNYYHSMASYFAYLNKAGIAEETIEGEWGYCHKNAYLRFTVNTKNFLTHYITDSLGDIELGLSPYQYLLKYALCQTHKLVIEQSHDNDRVVFTAVFQQEAMGEPELLIKNIISQESLRFQYERAIEGELNLYKQKEMDIDRELMKRSLPGVFSTLVTARSTYLRSHPEDLFALISLMQNYQGSHPNLRLDTIGKRDIRSILLGEKNPLTKVLTLDDYELLAGILRDPETLQNLEESINSRKNNSLSPQALKSLLESRTRLNLYDITKVIGEGVPLEAEFTRVKGHSYALNEEIIRIKGEPQKLQDELVKIKSASSVMLENCLKIINSFIASDMSLSMFEKKLTSKMVNEWQVPDSLSQVLVTKIVCIVGENYQNMQALDSKLRPLFSMDSVDQLDKLNTAPDALMRQMRLRLQCAYLFKNISTDPYKKLAMEFCPSILDTESSFGSFDAIMAYIQKTEVSPVQSNNQESMNAELDLFVNYLGEELELNESETDEDIDALAKRVIAKYGEQLTTLPPVDELVAPLVNALAQQSVAEDFIAANLSLEGFELDNVRFEKVILQKDDQIKRMKILIDSMNLELKNLKAMQKLPLVDKGVEKEILKLKQDVHKLEILLQKEKEASGLLYLKLEEQNRTLDRSTPILVGEKVTSSFDSEQSKWLKERENYIAQIALAKDRLKIANNKISELSKTPLKVVRPENEMADLHTSYKKEIEQLRLDMSTLRSENVTLRSELQLQATANKQGETADTRKDSSILQLQTANKKLSDEILALKALNVELKNELKNNPTKTSESELTPVAANEDKGLLFKVERLNETVGRITSQLEEKKAELIESRQEVQALEKSIAKLMRDNQQLLMQMGEAQVNQTKQKLESSTQELIKLRNENSTLRSKADSLEKQMLMFNKRLLDEESKRVAPAQNGKVSKEKDVHNVDEELKKSKTQAKKLEGEKARLQESHDKALKELLEKKSEAQKYKQENMVLSNKIKDLERKIASTKAAA